MPKCTLKQGNSIQDCVRPWYKAMAQSNKGKRTMVSIQSNLLLEELPSKASISNVPSAWKDILGSLQILFTIALCMSNISVS